jgi:hypothetical protein
MVDMRHDDVVVAQLPEHWLSQRHAVSCAGLLVAARPDSAEFVHQPPVEQDMPAVEGLEAYTLARVQPVGIGNFPLVTGRALTHDDKWGHVEEVASCPQVEDVLS